MEDIKFHKFVCYILNCISTDKTFIYQDGYKQVDYEVIETIKKSRVSFNDLNNNVIYDDGDTISDAISAADKTYIDVLTNNKKYFNIQQVPLYITSTDDKTLDIKKSIFQIFNAIKTSFDAKKWYIDNNFTKNVFQNNTYEQKKMYDLKTTFIGGKKIGYAGDNVNVAYEELLRSTLIDFVTILSKAKVIDPSVLSMYMLTKINYYLAKQYVNQLINSSIKYEPYSYDDLKDYEQFTGTIDNDYPRYYQNEILKMLNMTKTSETKTDKTMSLVINDNVNHIVRLFLTIKKYLKKSLDNTSSNIYKSPITYTYNPTNIRPLIYKRASESDLSNFATQIVSDSFLNKNKLPAIYDFKDVKPIIMMGGDSDVNNSSNVYKTIYVKILNMLNAKKITLNEKDKIAVENKLNQLEQLEKELKEELGNYAKYASVSHDKYETIDYQKVKQFLNDYEDKIKKYNSESAKIVRFIGKLTPYLY